MNNYQKVLNVTRLGRKKYFLHLDCGHDVYRYTLVAPKSVKCEWCLRPMTGEEFLNELDKAIERNEK